MKKILPFFVVLILLFSCKKELVKAPKNLIEKEKMVNILYDLSIMESIKMQFPNTLDSLKINSNDYILKKYKIDSVQFTKNNTYYAADYKEYKKMFEEVKARIDKNKINVEALVKIEKKKDSIRAKAKKNLKVADSIKKLKRELKVKKENDSIKKAKDLKALKLTDSLKKAKKKRVVL